MDWYNAVMIRDIGVFYYFILPKQMFQESNMEVMIRYIDICLSFYII